MSGPSYDLLVGSELTDDACLAAVDALDAVRTRHKAHIHEVQLQAAREVAHTERAVAVARRAYRERTGTNAADELPPFRTEEPAMTEKSEPRAWTDEEVRATLLDHLAVTVGYWASPNVARDYTLEQRMTGLVHSVLATLDGASAAIPGFVVTPNPHPDDEQFHRDEGENWYPSGPEHDIAGGLHEHWHAACVRNGLRA